MKRKTLLCLICLISIFAFACAKPDMVTMPNPNQGFQAQLPGFDISDSAKITYCVVGYFPASYNVYIFTDDTFYHYDYVNYWLAGENGFDYFKDSVPEDEQYLTSEGPIPEDVWSSIKKALTDNNFNQLPENLKEEGITDGAVFEIEVLDGSDRYFSGGYEAGYGMGNNHIKFNNIQIVLEDAVKECEESLKNANANDNQNEDSNNYVFIDNPTDENIFDYYSSDGSVFIRQDLNTQSSYINDNGRWIQTDIATGAYGPRIEKIDVDDDGVDEYVIAECEGTGTGFSVYGLIIIKDEGNKAETYKYDYSYFVNMIDESIDYNYYENTHKLEVHEKLPLNYDRYEGCSVTLGSDLTFEKIVYSDIIDISFDNGKIYMTAPIGCIYSEFSAPDYDNAIKVKAELSVAEDMSIKPLIWTISTAEK